MKTSIKKLSQQYDIPYSILRQRVNELPESIVEKKGTSGIFIHDVPEFEKQIEDLKKRDEIIHVEINPISLEEPADDVIEAEIVSGIIDDSTMDYLRQLNANRENMKRVANQAGKQDGLEIANEYQKAVIESFIERKQITDEAILNLLGK